MPFKDPEVMKRYMRKYMREYIRKRRAKYLNGKSCQACGSTEHLEFHHRNPAEKDTDNYWGWSKVRLERELAKCDVLCHECHVDWHAQYGMQPPEELEAIEAKIVENLDLIL